MAIGSNLAQGGDRQPDRRRPIGPRRGVAALRAWLYGLAILVALMVAVGGATRLTGSGLSITEWRPVTGAIPPVGESAWAAEFDRYRASPQYRLLNQGMSLDEFKFIYRWEWGHRQLGRAIGLYFFAGLAWFWWRGALAGRAALRLLGIGALGGLQAAIGWIMVASGLEPGMIAVAPVKLMLHLVVAAAILALLVATAVGLSRPERGQDAPAGAGAAAGLFLGLVGLQIALGALVAGSKAGLTYNTWPLMDGRLLPPAEALLAVRPWWENLVDNPALVQLDHRLVGYVVVGAALLQAVWLRGRGAAGRRALGLAVLAAAQMALGIATLLLVVPLWAALSHQLLAMALLAAAVAHLRLCAGELRRPAVAAASPGSLAAA